LHNKKYYVSVLDRIKRTQHKTKHNTNKWAKFVYIGKEKNITKLFKETSVKLAFTTKNTISNYLSLKQNQNLKQFEKSGNYQLNCSDCNMKYVGQTGRSCRLRFQEHFRDYKYANNKSKFSIHLMEGRHSIGPMEDIMKVLFTTNQGRLMDTMEKFYICEETRNNNQINDKNTIKPNMIYDVIVRENTRRAHTSS